MPTLLKALEKGTDPDRMKGALYVLWNKGTGEWLLRVSDSDLIQLLGSFVCSSRYNLND
jgi:hypothetical protein